MLPFPELETPVVSVVPVDVFNIPPSAVESTASAAVAVEPSKDTKPL